MDHVIVGAGPAGITAAETLAQTDPEAKVTLIGGEPGRPYGRMAIPYLLDGRIGEDGLALRPNENHFEDLAIRYVEDRAIAISAAGKELTLEAGGSMAYDRLLIATGSTPVMPKVPGLEGAGVHHCWTLSDARAIGEMAKGGASVVLLGAGFIGCIVMQALAVRECELTVIEAENSMVPRMMDRQAGEMIGRWCAGKGVRVITGCRVAKLERKGAAMRLFAGDGREIQADLVVVAAGVRPNTAFLEGSGIEIDGGVVVDEYLRSSDEAVFAAGDAARGFDFSTGERATHAIQPAAADHGRVAGLNMAGAQVPYGGSLSMNVLDTLGLISFSFGAWDGRKGGEGAAASDESRFRYLRLEFHDDRLAGALGVGLPDHVGMLRGLIQGRLALGPWKQRLIKAPHRFAEAYVACAHPGRV